jgi:hypothetical protein
MLHVFYLGVAKVYLVLHILQWDPPVVATCYSYRVTSGWHGARCWGTTEWGHKWAREKLSAGVGAHAVGCAKTRRCGLHFSCARSTARR